MSMGICHAMQPKRSAGCELSHAAVSHRLKIAVIAKKSDMQPGGGKIHTRTYEKPFWRNSSLELFFSEWCMSDFFATTVLHPHL